MFVGIFVVFKFLLFVGFGGCFSIFQHVSAFQQERIDKYGIPPLIVRLIALFIHSFVYINFFCYLVFSTNTFVVASAVYSACCTCTIAEVMSNRRERIYFEQKDTLKSYCAEMIKVTAV